MTFYTPLVTANYNSRF